MVLNGLWDTGPKGSPRELTMGRTNRSPNYQIWSLQIVQVRKKSWVQSLSWAEIAREQGWTCSKGLSLKDTSSSAPRCCQTFEHPSREPSNVNIQNSASVISSRTGDKTSLLFEVKISFIHRSPLHVLHSKSNLFCGLTDGGNADYYAISTCPVLSVAGKDFSLNYFQF